MRMKVHACSLAISYVSAKSWNHGQILSMVGLTVQVLRSAQCLLWQVVCFLGEDASYIFQTGYRSRNKNAPWSPFYAHISRLCKRQLNFLAKDLFIIEKYTFYGSRFLRGGSGYLLYKCIGKMSAYVTFSNGGTLGCSLVLHC